MAKEYPEILTDVGAHLAQLLESEGLQPERAGDVAFQVTEHIRKHWGGEEVYIPKAEHLEAQAKYAAVFEDWRAGLDFRELGRKHGYTRQWIGQIIRALRLARRQPAEDVPLFPWSA